LVSCAEDIPDPLTEEDLMAMLPNTKPMDDYEVEQPPADDPVGHPERITGKDGAEMVLIPAGKFEMDSNHGDNDESPVHTVYLDAFYIDVYEVTNMQYARFLNEYGKNTDTAGHRLLSELRLIEKVADTYRPKAGYDTHPVIAVTWYGAESYARLYGKRLPTEAEWEKAAGGGVMGREYPWGDNLTHDDANYEGTGGRDRWSGTAPVGSFAPNGYGLYDMSGNVWEWCSDWYDKDYYARSPKQNPTGPISGEYRVIRGGSWRSREHKNMRIAARNGMGSSPVKDGDIVGFRCAQDVTP